MRTPKLRRNGDGRAFAVYPNSGGRRKYFGTFGTAEAASAFGVWLTEVTNALSTGEPFPDDRRADRTISELALDYLRFAETYYAESRERENVERSVGLLVEHSGDLTGRQFGPNALRAFQSHLIASGRFARTTINAHVNRVRRFVKWCQSRELVPRGATEELATVAGLRRGKTKARETEPVGPVPWIVVRATLPFLGPVVRRMVVAQYWSGCRPGEVCRMRRADLETSGEVWWYRPARHKTAHRGHSLVKAIPGPAQAVLREAIAEAASAESPLFLTAHGNPWKRDTYTNAIHRGISKAQAAYVPVPKWSPNRLRHAILTDIRDRFGVEAAAAWGGHARPDTTALYTRRTEALLKQIASALSTPPVPSTPHGIR